MEQLPLNLGHFSFFLVSATGALLRCAMIIKNPVSVCRSLRNHNTVGFHALSTERRRLKLDDKTPRRRPAGATRDRGRVICFTIDVRSIIRGLSGVRSTIVAPVMGQ